MSLFLATRAAKLSLLLANNQNPVEGVVLVTFPYIVSKLRFFFKSSRRLLSRRGIFLVKTSFSYR